MLPLIGSLARGEKQGLLARRQPFFVNQIYFFDDDYFIGLNFFLAAPG